MRLRLVVVVGVISVMGLLGCSGRAVNPAPAASVAMPPAASTSSADLAFVRGNHIWTVHPDGSGASQVTTGEAEDTQPAWSPDQESLAFIRKVSEFSAFPSWLCVIPARGGPPNLTQELNSNLQAVCFSPDGSRVAFAGFASDSEAGPVRIGIVDLRSRKTVYLAEAKGLMVGSVSLSWSPDGTRLLLGEGGQDLKGARTGVITIATPRIAWLKIPDSNEAHWSPDGRTIAFNQHTRSFSAVAIADAGGTLRRVLVRGAGQEGTPTPVWGACFSPDGGQVAFAGDDKSIWVIGVDGSGKHKVIDNASMPAGPQGSGSGAPVCRTSASSRTPEARMT